MLWLRSEQSETQFIDEQPRDNSSAPSSSPMDWRAQFEGIIINIIIIVM